MGTPDIKSGGTEIRVITGWTSKLMARLTHCAMLLHSLFVVYIPRDGTAAPQSPTKSEGKALPGRTPGGRIVYGGPVGPGTDFAAFIYTAPVSGAVQRYLPKVG